MVTFSKYPFTSRKALGQDGAAGLAGGSRSSQAGKRRQSSRRRKAVLRELLGRLYRGNAQQRKGARGAGAREGNVAGSDRAGEIREVRSEAVAELVRKMKPVPDDNQKLDT
jgi:hypothetical protein